MENSTLEPAATVSSSADLALALEQKTRENELLRTALHQKEQDLEKQIEVVDDLMDDIRTKEVTFNMFSRLLEEEKEKARLALELAENEREKADRLLLNILPSAVARELKETSKVTPKRHNLVSVMFMDFMGFTKIAEKMEPEALVAELDRYFAAFDQIVHRYHLEKIKTIGDAYMCAGGIPEALPPNAVYAALAGLEIQNFMSGMMAERARAGKDGWKLRLGIHTGGPLVSGVIGTRKFAYDIWGDSVVTASRIESKGAPGEVNLSEGTYKYVSGYFDCESRGLIEVKNKVEPMGMYFIRGIRPELSATGQPGDTTPGAAFWAKLRDQFGADVPMPQEVAN